MNARMRKKLVERGLPTDNKVSEEVLKCYFQTDERLRKNDVVTESCGDCCKFKKKNVFKRDFPNKCLTLF